MSKVFVTLLTIILNGFLLIKVAGENFFLYKLEIDTIKDLFSSGTIGIHLVSGYYQAIPLFCILSFVGQLLLMFSFFIYKNTKIIKIGVILLWLALFIMLVNGPGEVLFFLLLKSLLFIVSSVWLYWLSINRKDASLNT